MAKRKEKRGFRLIISQTRRRGPQKQRLKYRYWYRTNSQKKNPARLVRILELFVSYFHFHDTVYFSRSQPNRTERNCNTLNHGEKIRPRRGKKRSRQAEGRGCGGGGANQHLSWRRGTTSTTKSTTAITQSVSGRFQHNPPHKNRGASGPCA